MRIKTFYTKTMSEALREIKAQLGPEALLLSTKEIPCRAGAWGKSSGFEVVAASDHTEDMDTFSPSAEMQLSGEEARFSAPVSLETPLAESMVETYSPATIVEKNPRASAKGAASKACSVTGCFSSARKGLTERPIERTKRIHGSFAVGRERE